MPDILHRIQMNASPREVFRALTENDFVRTSWQRDCHITMRLVHVRDEAHVSWRCISGPREWIDTDVAFDLAGDGDNTVVRLRHLNVNDAADYLADCTTKWGRMLLALKARLETPEPDDLTI